MMGWRKTDKISLSPMAKQVVSIHTKEMHLPALDTRDFIHILRDLKTPVTSVCENKALILTKVSANNTAEICFHDLFRLD